MKSIDDIDYDDSKKDNYANRCTIKHPNYQGGISLMLHHPKTSKKYALNISTKLEIIYKNLQGKFFNHEIIDGKSWDDVPDELCKIIIASNIGKEYKNIIRSYVEQRENIAQKKEEEKTAPEEVDLVNG